MVDKLHSIRLDKPLLIDGGDVHQYSLGPQHPMGPNRVRLAFELADHLGMLDAFEKIDPQPLPDGALERVHTSEYLAAARRNCADEKFGLGTQDNPLVDGLPELAARIVAGTLTAVELVLEGAAPRAVHLPGGLHHAFADKMAGFCMYNDAAVAIHWALDCGGVERIVYLDIDAHHGDGVERIFWEDPRVLTISLHESGLYLYPGTGFAKDIGGVNAAGTAVNIALPKNADDGVWLQCLHAIVPAILQKFKPQLMISQHGADPHWSDPLADLQVSINAMAVAYRSIGRWADLYAEGRWVALGGGGYHSDSVARAWTYLLAAVADCELDLRTQIPKRWEAITSAKLGDDGVDIDVAGFDPQRILIEKPHPAVVRTSRAVFPYWGLPAYLGS